MATVISSDSETDKTPGTTYSSMMELWIENKRNIPKREETG